MFPTSLWKKGDWGRGGGSQEEYMHYHRGGQIALILWCFSWGSKKFISKATVFKVMFRTSTPLDLNWLDFAHRIICIKHILIVHITLHTEIHPWHFMADETANATWITNDIKGNCILVILQKASKWISSQRGLKNMRVIHIWEVRNWQNCLKINCKKCSGFPLFRTDKIPWLFQVF